jgi:hypothetical protein
MNKVYVEDADVGKIVDYLAADLQDANSKPRPERAHAGGGTSGFRFQQDREPTRLPSLTTSNDRENGQKLQMRRDNDRFPPKSRCGLSYQACLMSRIVRPRAWRFAGTGSSLSFLIPRRRRDG